MRSHPWSSCTLSRRLYVPQKVSFPITLRYVDVMRQTNTDLEHAAESTMNDCWNVAGTPMLSKWVGRLCSIPGSQDTTSFWLQVCGLTTIEENTRLDTEMWITLSKKKEEIEIESWEKDKPMWRAARRERGSCKVPANGDDCATCLSDAQIQHCVPDALATPCIARDPAIYGSEIAKQHRSHRPQGNHV